jgi:hypothetical protein
MRRKLRLSLVSLGTSLLILLSVAPLASAAATTNTSTGNGGNGIRVSPVTTNITISAGTSQTVNVEVTNVTSTVSTLQAIVNDFTANPNESGDPEIILNPTQYSTAHSLKQFVQPIASVTLNPGQEVEVPVTITVPKTAAGGGYYGVVRFAPSSTAGGKNQNVSLAGSVGSLILVKVPGKLVEQMTIASFDVRKSNYPDTFFTSNKNLEATLRVQNEGNIQEQPFGKVLLLNRSGKTLASYQVNDVYPPGNVLPDSIREFSVPISSKLGSFGEYKIEGNFGYGSDGQLLSASTTFYVVPVALMVVAAVILIIIVFLIFGLPRVIRNYNRRIVRKAGRR